MVRNIQGNAQALRRDAAIYQRKRTISEIGRITADVRKLQNAMTGHNCLKAETRNLQNVTATLRSAEMNGDSERIAISVKKLIVLSGDILQKDCGRKP